jgi:hypothetical protein
MPASNSGDSNHFLQQKPACGAFDLWKLSKPHVNVCLEQAA